MSHPRPIGPVVENWQPAVAPPRGLILQGALVRLGPLSRAGAEALFPAFAGQDWLWDYMANGPFATASHYGDWAETALRDDGTVFLLIHDAKGGTPLGIASFLNIVPGHGSIEIGNICLSPALQGRPGATEALAMMMGWAFDGGYRRVEWKCNALNMPSRRAAQRLGFGYEGIFRQHMVVKGRNRDTAWYAVTDADWPALQDRIVGWMTQANFDREGRQKTRLSELTAPLRTADPAL